MEEVMMISVNSTNVSRDGSDSKSNSLHPCDRFQLDNARRDPILSTSRFKGVISQANGHWGAQIYVNHQRIWLGTFKSEKEAAMAYDSAALKLRSGESHRNVPWTNITVLEPHFQSEFSTEAVLSMIRDGSYASKFADYLRAQLQNGQSLPKAYPTREIMGKQLFQKELTPSDVGKLNRLVIPKKYAVKYFPRISDDPEQNEGGYGAEDTDLVFFDSSKRTWKFRYCYWKSSQSYVFTRGWNRFVKDNGLRAKDVVIFSLLERKNSSDEVQNLCMMIDVEYRDGTCSSAFEDADHIEKKKLLELKLSLSNMSTDSQGTSSSSQADFQQDAEEQLVENASAQKKTCFGTAQIATEQQKRLRLFGVQIV